MCLCLIQRAPIIPKVPDRASYTVSEYLSRLQLVCVAVNNPDDSQPVRIL
jgi:hypothetical protein